MLQMFLYSLEWLPFPLSRKFISLIEYRLYVKVFIDHMKIKMLANFSAMNTRHFIDWIFDANKILISWYKWSAKGRRY